MVIIAFEDIIVVRDRVGFSPVLIQTEFGFVSKSI
jgi:hypothetical protein